MLYFVVASATVTVQFSQGINKVLLYCTQIYVEDTSSFGLQIIGRENESKSSLLHNCVYTNP